LQQKVAQTIHAGVARQQHAAAQLIRGVQSYRTSDTGATLELSDQYAHARSGGANDHVMSDDPNFNPNGHLNGSWTALKPIPPQP